jgi:hypothetical protein
MLMIENWYSQKGIPNLARFVAVLKEVGKGKAQKVDK